VHISEVILDNVSDTHHPVAASYTFAIFQISPFSKDEHVDFPLLKNRKNLFPVLVLASLSFCIQIQLSEQIAFFGPRRPHQRQLIVCQLILAAGRPTAFDAGFIFISLLDDSLGEI
jgi:hypothetical protein